MKSLRTAKKLRRRGRNTARGWLAQAIKTYVRALESSESATPRPELHQTVREFVNQILSSCELEPRSTAPVSTLLDDTMAWAIKELGLATHHSSSEFDNQTPLHAMPHGKPQEAQQNEPAFQGLTPLSTLPFTPPLSACPALAHDPEGSLTPESVLHLRDFHPEIVLISPQIPPNTGTIARLCAAFSCRLHLIEPLGFDVSEKSFRRAGLDYWRHVELYVHPTWDAFVATRPGRRIILVETGGQNSPSDFDFAAGDLLVFGAETFGIPQNILAQCGESHAGHVVTIPMFQRGVRSLNLANTVSIVAHCALASIHSRGSALRV